MSCNSVPSSFPTVATVMGLSRESLGSSGTFVATIAVDPKTIMSNTGTVNSKPLQIKADDPITQALVDNINGSLPFKKEPEVLRCEICNVSVTKQVVLDAHLVGIKHAKKLKSLELLKEMNSAGDLSSVSNITNARYNFANGPPATKKLEGFSCRICNISVNSSLQLSAHMQGAKHKAKAESTVSNTTYIPAVKVGLGTNDKMVGIDVSANRLYCAACNIHVNSDIQLHQHITSKKHLDKVNGKTPQQSKGNWKQRNNPYQRPFKPKTNKWNTASMSNNFVSGGRLYDL